MHVDNIFGRLMAALEANGQANNTLVVRAKRGR